MLQSKAKGQIFQNCSATIVSNMATNPLIAPPGHPRERAKAGQIKKETHGKAVMTVAGASKRAKVGPKEVGRKAKAGKA